MSRRWRIALLLMGSGMCALIYQVAWLRELRLVFGAATPASAAVLAVFMGGLGLGSLRLSRLAEATPDPLALYAKLELAVAVTAAITPLLLWGVRAAYANLGGTTALGMVGGTVVRLAASALVLLPPTFLMGGTLPAAARAAEESDDAGRRHTALLYATNTLGAVLGATLTTFVLIEVFGGRLTLWLGCAVNALVAMVARALARSSDAAHTNPAKPTAGVAEAETRAEQDEADDDEHEDAEDQDAEDQDAEDQNAEDHEAPTEDAVTPAGAAPALAARFVLAASGAVGFVFLLLELVWYRMLAPLLGGSTYTFGLILAVALLGVGGGGLAYARVASPHPTLRTFALTCALEALCVAAPFALGDDLALLTLLLRPLGTNGLWGHALGWTLVTAIVVFPAALVAGFQFPLLIALLGAGRDQVARHVGLAYAWNTVGAILGSLAGGFLLLPWLTAPGSWQLAVVALCSLGAAALVVFRRGSHRPADLVAPLSVVVVALVLAILPKGPTAVWRHSPIGTGRADHVAQLKTRNELRHWMNEQRYGVTWQVDGRESSIALQSLYDTAFVMNGKTDGSALGDATTQVMGGLLGALLHGHVEQAMVIGLGTGSTAGWLGRVPSVHSIDVVEIEPAIQHVARELSLVNQQVLDNDKIHLRIGDAREILLTTPERYDLVFSEPSNPYRAGIASLFTQEFYQAVKSRLRPGGIFVQWVQGYDIDVDSIRLIYATLSSVFGSVASWQADVSDLLLIVGEDDVPLDVAALTQAIAEEPYQSALMGVWRVDDVEGLLAHHVARPSLATLIANAAGSASINTDDHNQLEFALARALGRPSGYSVRELHEAAIQRGLGRPQLTGSVRWERVADARLTMTMGRDSKPAPVDLDQLPTIAKARHRAFRAWAAGSYDAVLRAWAEVGEPPRTTLEHMVIADAFAATGQAAKAAPHIAAIAQVLPTEARALEARAAFFANQPEAALERLTRALTAYRTDPWPTPELMVRTLQVALALARRHSEMVEPLLVLVSEPFVTDSLRLERQRIAVDLAALHPDASRCVNALAPFEPHVVWEREFLMLRLGCYERARHALRATAASDLESFIDDDATPIDGGLLPPVLPH